MAKIGHIAGKPLRWVRDRAQQNAKDFKNAFDDTREAVGLKLPDAPEEQVIPLPDEEEIGRSRRRRAARRSGGRSSTILANDETFGP